MSANANGTATSLGIPTFNPAQDIAGPLGVNEMMQSIDSKIAARMFAPAAPSDKQVVKWSQAGGAWVAGFVAPSELAQEGATDKQALVWSTASGKWIPSTVSQEIAYVEFTGSVSATSNAEASAVTVVSAGAIAFDGATKIRVEFFTPQYWTGDSGNSMRLTLFDGTTATIVGMLANPTGQFGATSAMPPLTAVREFTPAAGTHTYFVGITDGGGVASTHPKVVAGAGGALTLLPGFIRITRAA